MAVKKLYFAPMEGVAGYIFRNIYADFFDDADKFFSPFVVTRPSGIMKNFFWFLRFLQTMQMVL